MPEEGNLKALSDLLIFTTYKEDMAIQQFEASQIVSPSTLREFILWGDVNRLRDDIFKANILTSILIEIRNLSAEIIEDVKKGTQNPREALKIIEDLEIVAVEIKDQLEDI